MSQRSDSSPTSRSAYDAFRERIDDTILLAVAAAHDEEIELEDFMEREFDDALARLSERDFIERNEE